MASKGWYFCLKHQRVEQDEGCRSADRLGPYDTRDTASQALDIARQRSEAYDEADRRWDGED